MAPCLQGKLRLVCILGQGIGGKDDLVLLDPCCGPDGFAKSEPHTLRNTVRTRTGGLLVLAQYMVRENAEL